MDEDVAGRVPPARDSFGLALDGTGTTPILVGGGNTTQLFSDTWAYEFPPIVEVGASASTGEAGESLGFSFAPYYGTAPYVLTVTFGDGTFEVVTGSNASFEVSHVFAHPGTFEVSATLTDAVGATATTGAAVAVTVTAGPAVGVVATPTLVDPGTEIAFGPNLTAPGVAPYAYEWSFGDGNTTSGANVSHSYARSGTYRVELTMTDHAGVVTTGWADVTVVADPVVHLVASSAKPTMGLSDAFSAAVTGGVAPYEYTWSFGDGTPKSTEVAPYHTFSVIGTYTVELWANDSFGRSAEATMSVTVTSASSPGGTSGTNGSSTSSASAPPPTWFWAGIAGLFVVAVVGSGLIVRRSRAGRTPTPSPPSK